MKRTDRADGKLLSFGTSGLRALMGDGPDHMNESTVRLSARALALTIPEMPEVFSGKGVAVCYDCRNNSRRFAEICAEELCRAGIPVLFFQEMRPTPELSFAVRYYGCAAGINVTASHNPKEYNGLKVYGADGGQLVAGPSDRIAGHMKEIGLEGITPGADFEELAGTGLLRLLGRDTDLAFLEQVERVADVCGRIPADFKIVYTPFHGTGAALIPQVLDYFGARSLFCVESQMQPDGDFSTVASPNPEYAESFQQAVELADRVGADWIIGSDPDADRLAVLYRDRDGSFVHPDFSVTGAVLFDWYAGKLKNAGSMPENPIMIKSLVTTELGRAAAEYNGCQCRDTFTGFKYLTEEKDRAEAAGEGRVIFSYEESYGCMVGDYCRDKDAVSAAVMLCCMAGELSLKGKNFGHAIEDLFCRVGFYAEKTVSLTLQGEAGQQRIARYLEALRACPPRILAGHQVLSMQDLLPGTEWKPTGCVQTEVSLKGENVLRFVLSDGAEIIIRPSGTEPKLRFYLMAHGGREHCVSLCDNLAAWAEGLTV